MSETKERLKSSDMVRDRFLGVGIVVQRLDAELLYVLWDNTPPEEYNCGVNPSVVFEHQLEKCGEEVW